jgi:hypothetical protein
MVLINYVFAMNEGMLDRWVGRRVMLGVLRG